MAALRVEGWDVERMQDNRAGWVAAAVAVALVVLALSLAGSAAQAGPTGFLEICKQADGSGVTGNFDFTVAGQTVSVPVGACSAALELAAGPVTVTEAAVDGISVSAVTATPGDHLLGTDLAGRSAQVFVAAGDVSAQTTVTFTNKAQLAPVKVCKVAGTGVAVGSEFTFAVGTVAVSVPAGPAPGGYCTVTGSFPVASDVTISEVVPRGMEVSAITVGPASRLVGAANTDGATVVVRVGSGATEATFTNQTVGPPSTTPTTVAPSTTTTLPSGGGVSAVSTTTTALPAVPTSTTTTVLPCTVVSTTLPGTPMTTTTTVAGGPTSTTIPCSGVLPATTVPPAGGSPTTTTTVAPAAVTTTTAPGGSGVLPVTTTIPAAAATTTTAPPGSGVLPVTTTIPAGETTTTVPGGSGVVPASTTTSTVPGSGALPATTVPPSPGPTLPGPGGGSPGGAPATFRPLAGPQTPALVIPGPAAAQLSHTGADSARALRAAAGLILVGLLLLAGERLRPADAAALDVDDDEGEFPALTFEPIVRAPARRGLPRRAWRVPPDVEAGPGQGPGEAGAGVDADGLPWPEPRVNAERRAQSQQRPVVVGQLALALPFLGGRDRLYPPVPVQPGIDLA